MSNPTREHLPGFRVGEPFIRVAAAHVLKSYEQVVEVNNGSAFAITLPRVAEAAGRIYTFYALSTFDVTFVVPDNEAPGYAAIEALTLSDAGDKVALYCDGRDWWVIHNTGA